MPCRSSLWGCWRKKSWRTLPPIIPQIWSRRFGQVAAAMTISLIHNGLHIDQGTFRYAWYKLVMDGREFYRAVAFKELTTLTMDPRRENEGILGIQWGAVRGLYNAGINFIYTACGIFKPEHIG